MDELIQPGQALRMERSGAAVVVEDQLGWDDQGVVYRSRVGGVQFAVKWILRGADRALGMRTSISELIRRGRPPHASFVWPIDLVGSDQVPGFGYIMPLLEPRFTSLTPILTMESGPSLRVIAAIGRELADAFAALHSLGLCYRNISLANLRFDQQACELAVIDNDVVGVDGNSTPIPVQGIWMFMAPEIVRGEALPSTATDLHSLAVLLFYVLMKGHPLLGIRADASYDTEYLEGELGARPLFIFDPDDRSNGPVPGDSVTAWWPIYPEQIRRVFTQAFTTGLHDPLHGRVPEETWRRALLALHDCVSTCPGCHVPVYCDLEQPGQPCWQCGQVLPARPLLQAPGGTLVLSDGAVVTSHHLDRDHDHRTARAAVEPHPGQPGQLVLRNLTGQTWTITPDGEEPKQVAPRQRLAVRPLQIDFGTAQGKILDSGSAAG
jgi:eukaryotic-like serine/threonine-protein kinase